MKAKSVKKRLENKAPMPGRYTLKDKLYKYFSLSLFSARRAALLILNLFEMEEEDKMEKMLRAHDFEVSKS